MKQYIREVYLALVLIFCFGGQVILAEEALRLNMTAPILRSFYYEIFEELSERTGIQIQWQTPPIGRSLVNANQGIDDGDGPRARVIEEQYPNLIRIPERLINSNIVALSKNSEISIQGWESLKPYNVAYLRGRKILAQKILGAKSVTKAKSVKALFTLLEKDRTDIIILSHFYALKQMSELKIREIHILQKPLMKMSFYFYLNLKHKDLAEQLGKELKKMKQEGLYQKIYDQAFSDEFPPIPQS